MNTTHSTEIIRPTLFVRIVMRPMTRVLNPVIRKFAGKRHFGMAAQIHHVGRQSGRAYVTPASARLEGVHFLVPLTFGNISDWSRNLRAAGEGMIRWKGTDYLVGEPALIGLPDDPALIRSAFKPHERAMFRVLGIKQFLKLRVVPVTRSRAAEA
jgi:hypothetical protein